MRAGWTTVALGEVATISRQGVDPTTTRGDTVYLGLEHIEAGGRIISWSTIRESAVTSTKFRFGPEHILFGKLRPYLGKIAAPNFTGVCSTDILPVLPSPQLDRDYLKHFLRQPDSVDLASVRSTGANLPRLSPSELARFEVPLPPIEEQRRIAAILDQADAVRMKRSRALVSLHEAERSFFLAQFGDPVANAKGFSTRRLADLGVLDRGVSRHRPRNDPRLLGGIHPLIQTGDVTNSGGYITRFTSTYSDLGLSQSRMWPRGTLCITIAANIARTGILQFDACFPDSVVGFSSDPATTQFVRVWLGFLQEALESSAPQSAQKNINLATLHSLTVIDPGPASMALFSERMYALNKLRDSIAMAQQAELKLIHSLQAQAFSGRL